jgi:hypothetical protein
MWQELPDASKEQYKEAFFTEQAAFNAKYPDGPPKVLNVWLFRWVLVKLCAHQVQLYFMACMLYLSRHSIAGHEL